MAADLHIHALVGVTKEDLTAFMDSSTAEVHEAAFRTISHTPDVWIGEVSWLKAELFDKPGEFIPGPVQAIFDLIGDDETLPILTPELREKILDALHGPNTTSYRVADAASAKYAEVVAFLDKHMGERLFTVSW